MSFLWGDVSRQAINSKVLHMTKVNFYELGTIEDHTF